MPMELGPIDLLIFQATSFCNLDCKYCYLPARSDTSRISKDVVLRAVQQAAMDGLLGAKVTILWHAGEPLTVPVQFYEEVFMSIKAMIGTRTRVTHTFQTNATTLTDEWCALISRHNVRMGVSIDGPAFIHNLQRVTRSGHGTFDKVMAGISRLREHSIPFYTISVLTDHSLDHPDTLFEFFCGLGADRIGFNVEEAEGVHKTTSLDGDHSAMRVKAFFQKFYSLYRKHKPSFKVREFEQVERAFSIPVGNAARTSGQQLTPFRIITIGHQGDFSTFSPELLTMSSAKHPSLTLGNIYQSRFVDAVSTDRFQSIYSEIRSGINKCADSCQYFGICGGGSPSNKLSEHGRFDVTETAYCRHRHQALPEALLSVLESDAALQL